jgi:WD40 repeat protein
MRPILIEPGEAQSEYRHQSPITGVEWSPDGSKLATSSYDGTVKIWNNDRVLYTFRHYKLTNSVRWSPTGRYLATASADRACRVWDIHTGKIVSTLTRHTDDVNSVTWLGDDQFLVTVSEDGTGRKWTAMSGQLYHGMIYHDNHVMSVDWSTKWGILASCGEDGNVKTWTKELELLDVWPQNADMECCRWSPEGLLALGCDDGFVRVVDKTGAMLTELGPCGGAVKSVAWSPDGHHIAAGSYNQKVTVWDVETGQCLGTVISKRIWPRSVSWNSSTDCLAVGAFDGIPTVVAPSKARFNRIELRHDPRDSTHGINALSIHKNDIWLASDDGHVYLWKVSALPSIETYTLVQSDGEGSLVNAIAVDPKERFLSYGLFDGQYVIRRKDGLLLHVGHCESPINSISLSPDGKILAIATYAGKIHLLSSEYPFSTQKIIQAHNAAIKSIAWLSNNQIVSGATDALVKITSIDSGDSQVLEGHGNLIDSVSVSRGPRPLIASAARDRTVRIWDPEVGKCLRTLIGHDESLKSVCWMPGSRTVLLSGSYDFDARIWNIKYHDGDRRLSQTLTAHTQAVNAVGWWNEHAVTASWDGSCIIWAKTQEMWRPVYRNRITPFEVVKGGVGHANGD